MTKEEIREGDWAVEFDRRESITQWLEALVGNEKAVGILAYLHSHDVVIKGIEHPRYVGQFSVESLI